MLRLQAGHIGTAAQPILHDIDLRVEAGERVLLLGPSGAGKTTLLNALYRQAGAGAAYLPQPQGLVGPLPARHNIALGRIDRRSLWGNLRALLAMSARERAAIATVARRLELEALLEQRVDTLSGGQQSRVALARALYRGGPLLIADEPASALDPRRVALVLEVLRDFDTLVCSLHDVAAARELATRLVGLREGRVLFDAAPDAVSAEQIAALYAAAPAPGGVDIEPPLRLPRGCQ